MGGAAQASDLLSLARDMGLDPEFEGWVSRVPPARRARAVLDAVDVDDAHAILTEPDPEAAPPPTVPARPVARVRVAVPRPAHKDASRPRRAPRRLALVGTIAVAVFAVGLFSARFLAPNQSSDGARWRAEATAARRQVTLLTARIDAARAAAKSNAAAEADRAAHGAAVARDIAACADQANALVALLAHIDPHELAPAANSAQQVAQTCNQARADVPPPPPSPPGR